MEPMTLGSPNTSLNTSLYDSSAVNNSQFLPSFLLGTEQGSFSTATSPRLISPTKSHVSRFHNSSDQYSSVNGQDQKDVNLPTDKPEGPPTLSLADYSLIHFQRQVSDVTDASSTQSHTRDFIDETSSENWVTVFGFSPSQLELVLSYFVRFGEIIDKKHSINGGNWLHIRYSNRREVQAALSQNGKQIASNLMIGVVSKKDQHILNSSRRNVSFQTRSDLPNLSTANSPYSPPIRRLTVASNDTEVVSHSNLPTKGSGVLSKTMEYLFGW